MTRDTQDVVPATPVRRTRKGPSLAAQSASGVAAKPVARRGGSPRAAAAPAPEALRAMVAEAAYFRAERRGFLPGAEMDDWLSAEAEVLTRLGHTPACAPAAKTRRKTASNAGTAGTA